ncbi:MAG: OadG family protein, partial [Bacteroidota bacterium]
MNPYLLAAFGYAVVFLVLLTLYLVFQNLPRLLGSITRVEQEAKKMVLAAQENFTNGYAPPPEKTSKAVLTGEVNAAIA